MTESQESILQEELTKFMESLSKRKEMNGVTMQIARYRPFNASGFVTSLYIGNSANDTKLAIEQLVSAPRSPEYTLDELLEKG